MIATAEAMGCRFVYAIVPATGRIEDVFAARARVKAASLVGVANDHMALERRGLPDEKNRSEIERIADELVRIMPSDLWTDK